MKKIGKMIAGALVLTAILGTLSILPANAQSTVISIPDASALTEESVTVPITITNVTDLAGANIWLHYNSSAVIAEGVSNGDLGGITNSIDNAAGITKMLWDSAEGKTGNFVFAHITLKAVGLAYQTSNLDLEIRDFFDTEFDDIPYNVENGTFTVEEQPVIEFIPPTPANDSEITVNYVNVTVNVTDPSDVSIVLLNWDGANRTMHTIDNNTWSNITTNLANGEYTYKVYANDTHDNWGISDTRVVTVNITGGNTLMEGDVSQDMHVKLKDATLIKFYVAGKTTLNEDQLKCADTFDDGEVNLKDATFIKKWMADPTTPLWQSPADDDMLEPVP